MIRAEIKFKNSEFIVALKKNGYRSIAEFSRKSKISYHLLIEYANLKTIFKDEKTMNKMIEMLNSDEWTLFEQYREVVERQNGATKIVTDIPIDKIISLENKSLLQLESPDRVDEFMVKESLRQEVAEALDTLKDREKQVLKMYFGIDGKGEKTLEEIAEEFGIKRERTRQIKEKALRRLKNRSRSKKLECYL